MTKIMEMCKTVKQFKIIGKIYKLKQTDSEDSE